MAAESQQPRVGALLTMAFLLTSASGLSAAEPPQLLSAFPSAIGPSITEVTLRGQRLQSASAVWTSFPSVIEAAGQADSDSARFRLSTPAPLGGIGLVRVWSAEGISNLLPIMVDDLPTVASSGANRSSATAQTLSLPAAVEGICAARQVDYFRFSVSAGQRLEADVVAARLGSELDALLRLVDSEGRELAYCDDGPDSPDPRLTYLVETDGELTLEVRDTRYDGGAKHRYRLRASHSTLSTPHFLPLTGAGSVDVKIESEPNDEPATATPVDSPGVFWGTFAKAGDRDYYAVTVEKDSRWVMAGATRGIGSPCDLHLELFDEEGRRVARANVGGIDEGTITNTFAKAGTYILKVEELNRLGGPDLRYELTFALLPPGFVLEVETGLLQAAPGGEATMKVSASRRDYQGPIQLEWWPPVDGLNGKMIPEKEGALEWKVALPEGMRPGQWFNLRLRGHAKIGDAPFTAEARTTAAVEKLFPVLLYPPREFNGLITLGVKQ